MSYTPPPTYDPATFTPRTRSYYNRGNLVTETVKDLEYWWHYFVGLGRKIFTREHLDAWGKLFGVAPKEQDFGTTGHEAPGLLKAAVGAVFAAAGGAAVYGAAQAASKNDARPEPGSALVDIMAERARAEKTPFEKNPWHVEEPQAFVAKENNLVGWVILGAIIAAIYFYLKKRGIT